MVNPITRQLAITVPSDRRVGSRREEEGEEEEAETFGGARSTCGEKRGRSRGQFAVNVGRRCASIVLRLG
jgi:hypothetical protein